MYHDTFSYNVLGNEYYDSVTYPLWIDRALSFCPDTDQHSNQAQSDPQHFLSIVFHKLFDIK